MIVSSARPGPRSRPTQAVACLGGHDLVALTLRVQRLLVLADGACEGRRRTRSRLCVLPASGLILLALVALPHVTGTATMDALHRTIEAHTHGAHPR